MIFGLYDFVMFIYHFGPVTFPVLLTRFPGPGIVDSLFVSGIYLPPFTFLASLITFHVSGIYLPPSRFWHLLTPFPVSPKGERLDPAHAYYPGKK